MSPLANKISLTLLTVVVGIGLIPTVAEFIVAFINRYSVYPLGIDTNMLANSILLEGIFIFALTFILLRLLWKVDWLWVIIRGFAISLIVWLTFIFVGFPSLIPQEWCRYELKIVSCQDYINNPQWGMYGPF